MSSTPPAVRLDQVTKDFGSVRAVDEITLEVHQKQFLTILGPSGAGKSTLLSMIAGFERPTRGSIYIDGEDVTETPPYDRNIGMVFQSMALFPHMTVGENIAFPLEMRRFDPGRISDRVDTMLDLIDLPEAGGRAVSELSGGQKQRVAVARALAFEPSILLLDEPLSSLDKKLRESMRAELLRIHREAGVTTIHVTHNQEEALTMADTIAVIRDGDIEQHAPPGTLYDQPSSRFVADFIGDTNFFEGAYRFDPAPSCVVMIGDREYEIPGDCRIEPPTAETTLDIGVRNEQIQIGPELSTEIVVSATVDGLTFAGDTVTYRTAPTGATESSISVTTLKSNSEGFYERGDTVEVGWNAEDTFVFSADGGDRPAMDP
ncbi:MAG: ABC transporter ATP-binding protein [Halodesulfurarchaeum sp.]